jgi:hypothetical protein
MQTAPESMRPLGLRQIGSEVQIGVENLTGTQFLDLDCLRLFHFDDHVGLGEDLVGGIEQPGSGALVGLVGERGTLSGTLLDHDTMSVPHELGRTRWCQSDAKLVVLDLCGYSDDHGSAPLRGPAHPSRMRPGNQQTAVVWGAHSVAQRRRAQEDPVFYVSGPDASISPRARPAQTSPAA